MRTVLRRIFKRISDLAGSRILIIGIIFAVLAGILVHRLYVLQIIEGEDYLNTFTYRIQKDVEIQSARGNIYDCDGNPLAYNELSYTITIEDSTLLTDNATKNAMVATLIDFIESTGNTAVYDLPFEFNEKGDLAFGWGESRVIRFKKDIYSTENLTEAQSEASAQEVYEYMRGEDLFNLDESYDTEEALKILSVRYDLWMKRYEKYLSVTVATDASDELVAMIKENADILPGVSVEIDYSRVYVNSKYFSNIIGYIGLVSEEELEQQAEAGDDSYSSSDMIGKAGLEAAYESVLRGTKGSETLYVNSLGSVLETSDTVEPTAGQDIYLTIDTDMQITAYNMLEERIAGILLTYMVDTDYPDDDDYYIPVKDFYYALIDNNVIDLSHISAETASEYEKSFWNKLKNYESSIIESMEGYMSATLRELSSENRNYVKKAYSMLKDYGILDVSPLNSDDEMMTRWNNNRASFKELIEYAISMELIDFSQLDLTDDYLNTDDIYEAVVEYVADNILDYDDFAKDVIYYMLYGGYIKGADIALMLYDQGILEKDSDYELLRSGSLTDYQYMYRKVYNLEITPDMLALEPCSGSYVMVDVNTGEVKALVSYPGYDANRINESSYFSSLVNNDASPFFNRATMQTIAPGSTYKPLVAVAALEEGVITGNTKITDEVTYTKIEPYAHCWSSVGHGSINVVDALKYSCNYFFYEVGYRLGSNNNTTALSDTAGLQILADYASMFGLDQPTGIEISEAAGKISDESVVRSAIGQGTNNFTATQLARYIMTVANYGYLYELTIIDRITDPDGGTVFDNSPVLTSKLDISDSTWETVHQGLYEVCNTSSYREQMGGRGVVMAGKSGTAQESESSPNHGLFVGYAPYNDPEVAAVLIIPNGYGSAKLLDLYADLMCYYFDVSDYDASNRKANLPDSSTQAD